MVSMLCKIGLANRNVAERRGTGLLDGHTETERHAAEAESDDGDAVDGATSG